MEVYVMYEIPYLDGQSFIYGVTLNEERADKWSQEKPYRYVDVFIPDQFPGDWPQNP